MCVNFFLFLMSGADGIFHHNFLNSPNVFKFKMHVSDDDSNKDCKFHKILKKC